MWPTSLLTTDMQLSLEKKYIERVFFKDTFYVNKFSKYDIDLEDVMRSH